MRGADAGADLVEGLVPRDPLPLPLPRSPTRFIGYRIALGVVDLVEGGRALGAVAAAAGRVLGVALELGDLAGLLVEVGDQSARRLAVEAGGGDDRVVALDLALGPRLGVELGPVVPAIVRAETW